MTNEMIMPRTAYVVATDFNGFGLGNAGDMTDSIEDAADQAAECMDKDGQPFRAFRLDFDVETNALESASDVTDEITSIIAARCADNQLETAE